MALARLDAFERRIQFRRVTAQGREAVVLDRVVCWACMVHEIADRCSAPVPTLPLFEETTDSSPLAPPQLAAGGGSRGAEEHRSPQIRDPSRA